MSTGVENKPRPGLLSYLGFGSHTRRRSVSQTLRSPEDPFEKPDRHSRTPSSSASQSTMMAQSQRSRYLKTGGIVAAIVFILYMLAPANRPALGGSAVADYAPSDSQSESSSGTEKCTKSFDSSKPLIQYALMIDAGSTGSRIHVYRFNNCGPTPELEDEVFKTTERKEGGSGLSSYKGDAEGAAKSLDMLMDVAVESVPDEYKSCTPVAVKATAGLRMLGKEMSDNILNAVRQRLETVYPFPVVSADKGGVEIMDGSEEGVYAWITTNYLLGKIGGPDENPTAAVFDLGGGSTQIVFEPTFKASKSGGMPEKLADGDHKYTLDFGGREFSLYQHSHLGYGLMAGREAIHRAVVDARHAMTKKDHSWLKKPVQNPCILPGMEREVTVELDSNHVLGSEVTVKMVGPKGGSPSSSQCRALAEKVLQKDAPCTLAPCSFNGVHQPSLEATFAKEDVYVFSYFYDRTEPLGMPESFTVRELHELTHTVCAGEKSWDVFSSIPDAISELKDRPEWCLDLNFMLALLHTGYEMPLDREVKIAKQIKGNELGWCLGASLPLLNQESGWQCRVKEIS